jgi:tetratricopeptide (TPR) repeat protein
MRYLRVVFVTLALVAPLPAGVYNLAEIHPPLALEDARSYYLRIRSASVPVKDKDKIDPYSFKGQIVRQAEALEQLRGEDRLSTIDRINLAGCYLRLGGDNNIAKARRLLVSGEPNHFLIQSNLAAAYFMSGELGMAVRHQQKALALWPEVFVACSDKQLRFFRECERYLLKLYQLRAKEAVRGSTRGEVDLDALFPGLRFVGPSGEYEAGELSIAMRDLLPENAFNIVFQINTWFPDDPRLYWLLGEMLNASGAIDQAHDIFFELVEGSMGGTFKDLFKHRRVLMDAKPIYLAFRDPEKRGVLLSELLMIGKPPMASSPMSDAVYLASSSAMALFAVEAAKEPIPGLGGAGDPQALMGGITQPTAVFNFRHIAIGFLFGFIVALLCAMQWQEWRRRRTIPRLIPEESEPVSIGNPDTRFKGERGV